MEKGKIIVVEGTDCSGKETQSKKLIEKLNKEGIKTCYYSFPNYETPTGKIIGLPYLGKPYLAQELVNLHIEEAKIKLKEKIKKRLKATYKTYNKRRNIDLPKKHYNEELIDQAFEVLAEEIGIGWFSEGAPNVDSKIASGYYAIDRAYNLPIINELLEKGNNVILDRYIYSNMAHQGGKKESFEERKAFYEWDRKLEMEMYGLPESDIRVFLHMPTEYVTFLKNGRTEALDEHERNFKHLRDAETAYLEIASLYDFTTIDCIGSRSNPIAKSDIKTKDEISKEVFDTVVRKLTL